MSNHTLIDIAMEHPRTAGMISVCSFLFSILLKTIDNIYDLHVPPIIIEILQIIGLIVAIPAGIITVYSFFKKMFSGK